MKPLSDVSEGKVVMEKSNLPQYLDLLSYFIVFLPQLRSVVL